ncbi:hypothetical protein Tco_0194560 [Tanacetum coccineum]
MDHEIKQLKRSRIPIIKVRWNSKRGPEFTWERDDQFKQKYPHLFTKTVPSGVTKGRVETSTDTSLGEDASKQRRSSDKTKPMFTDSDFDVLDAEQITTTGPSDVSTADQIDPKDKGKSVLVKEEPKKVKSRDQGLAQIESDAELAQRLHEEELAELDRAQIERQRQEEATNADLTEEFDEIQARINADALFAAKLQQEEGEQFTIEERA